MNRLKHWVLSVSFFIFPLILCRFWLYFVTGRQPGDELILGLLLDSTTACVSAVSFVVLARYTHVLFISGIYFFYVLYVRSAYEYARVFSVYPVASYISQGIDTHFLLASFPSLLRPVWLIILLGVSCVLLFVYGRFTFKKVQLWLPLIIMLVFSVSLFVMLPSSPAWYAGNPWTALLATPDIKQLPVNNKDSKDILTRHISPRDLKGTPLLQSSRRAKNVLLLIIEGMNGYTIKRLQNDEGVEFYFDDFFGVNTEALRYTHFISHYRQTDRGLYSLLCGDVPELVAEQRKADLFHTWEAETMKCLPRYLSEAGFYTAYLQSCVLYYMKKDKFLPRMGFQSVEGARYFREMSGYRTGWGINDRDFLKGALKKIELLEKRKEPWFLTLLTSGTHHPFLTPEDNGKKIGSKKGAFQFLDKQLAFFYKELKRRGILQNTLLIITGDEATKITGVDRPLNEQWGALVVNEPAIESQKEISELFTQSDIALSVLDYFNIVPETVFPVGRSVFQKYRRPRSVIFANSNWQNIGFFDSRNTLTLCDFSFKQCRAYAYNSPHFLWNMAERTTTEPAVQSTLLLKSYVYGELF